MESITAARATALSIEEQLAGTGMLSVETQEEYSEDSFLNYCREHFAQWLRMVRTLPSEQQEMLLSYYLLGKTQSTLAVILSTTQTVCSFRIRMAIKLAGTFLMMGGVPTLEQMRSILVKAGLENKLNVPLSELIAEYASCRSFATIAYRHRLHRPAIRRAMSQASQALLGKDQKGENLEAPPGDPEAIALGAYIFALIDKANPEGTGKSKRQRAKTARLLVLREPTVTGQFRVDCKDPDFDDLFVSRANL